MGLGQRDVVPIHGAAPLRWFDKTVNTLQYALHISTYMSSFRVDFFVSHLLFTSVATIHECNVEDTFCFEKPVHSHRQGYLDKNTYGSRQEHLWFVTTTYGGSYKTYLNSTLFGIHLHTVYSYNHPDVICTTMVPV